MNFFNIVLVDGIFLLFPIMLYLIYLSTDKNTTKYEKNIYFSLALITSLFLTNRYGINDSLLIPIFILNSVVILSFINNNIIFGNILGLVILLIYRDIFNSIYLLLIFYLIITIIYLLIKKYKVMFIQVFIFINSIINIIWIKIFNIKYYDNNEIILIVLSYFFLVNIVCMMYEIGVKILKTHLTYKELQQDKEIRLSLFKITHEIKNPIAVIKGYLDMINTNDLEQVNRFIPIIKSEIDRLLILLQDFLFINKVNLTIDIMDINMLIEEQLKKMDNLIKKNNIIIKNSILDDEVYINGDYNRLSQVIVNVIKNSIEALTETKNGYIDIITRIEKNNFILIIRDNGMGMDKETLKRFNEPFFTTKAKGTGLGVSLIYEIIEAHNGNVVYESELGIGTKVKISLPICD